MGYGKWQADAFRLSCPDKQLTLYKVHTSTAKGMATGLAAAYCLQSTEVYPEHRKNMESHTITLSIFDIQCALGYPSQ